MFWVKGFVPKTNPKIRCSFFNREEEHQDWEQLPVRNTRAASLESRTLREQLGARDIWVEQLSMGKFTRALYSR